MTVREYFKRYGNGENVHGIREVTFIIAKAEKDEHSPYNHPVYTTTPIRVVGEWMESKIMDYIVLNDCQPPIDWMSGAMWKHQFKRGWLTSMLIISREELCKLYSEEQAASMEAFINKEIMAKYTE